MLINKAFPLTLCRDAARFFVTKPSITISCDPLINWIAQPERQPTKKGKPFDRSGQACGNPERCSRFNRVLRALLQNNRIQLIQ